MKILFYIYFAMGMSLVVYAQTEMIGRTEAQVIAEKGKPVSKTVVGNKAIYRWDDMEIGFLNGKVANFTPRNIEREAELRQQSTTANKEAAKRKLQIKAQQKKNFAINENHRIEQEQAAQLVQQEKEQQDMLEQQQKRREQADRDFENQKTQQLQVRPKTAQEQAQANAAATKAYNERRK